MSPDRKLIVAILSLGAGSLDTLTGLLIIFAPVGTVGMFGAAAPAGDDIALRFVGAFVAGIGLSYLWAIGSWDPNVRARRLPGVWGATAVVRACIAIFVSSAVAMRRLDMAWLVVSFSDAFLAATQTVLLRAGWLRTNT